MIDTVMLVAGLWIGHKIGVAVREAMVKASRLKYEKTIREAIKTPRWDGWELDDIRWDDDKHVTVVMKPDHLEEP